MDEIKGLKRIGDYDSPEYGILPLYETYGFINTEEGWNLLARLGSPMHPEYVAAKAAYEVKGAVV